MYTHVCGYKFGISIDANGRGAGREKAICVDLWAMPGEYDRQLKWPAKASFTLEQLHQHRGENEKHTIHREWRKPEESYIWIGMFGHIPYRHFMEHSELESFLRNDTLYFHLSNITLY